MSRPLQNRKPEIIFFAGPNGSGKSTITQLFQIYMDADDIKKARCAQTLKLPKKPNNSVRSTFRSIRIFALRLCCLPTET